MKDLLKKYMEGAASAWEVKKLMLAWDIYADNELLKMIAEISPTINATVDEAWEAWEPPVKEIIDRSKKAARQKIIRPIINALPSAAIYLTIIAGTVLLIWLFTHPSKLRYSCGGLPEGSESPTGVYTCKLILDNGCSILIDSSHNGIVTKQGNREIIKLESGALLYKKLLSPTSNDSTKPMYNTITTARGAQYRVILPDGTKLRLNAASSIRFPVEFSENARFVEVEGEAFFEVAPNKTVPFYAKAGNTVIKVMGTRFNVNAYSGNTIATLLSGSLEVKSGPDSVLLQPGQQAIVWSDRQTAGRRYSLVKVSRADTAQVVSWKKVEHVYLNIAMKDFITDIGRCYNLEMINMGGVPDRLISVTLCYNTPVAEVLKLFREMGLRFKQEGNSIIFAGQITKPGLTMWCLYDCGIL
jgi:hypothetical protein